MATKPCPASDESAVQHCQVYAYNGPTWAGGLAVAPCCQGQRPRAVAQPAKDFFERAQRLAPRLYMPKLVVGHPFILYAASPDSSRPHLVQVSAEGQDTHWVGC